MNAASTLDRVASHLGPTWWKPPLFFSHELSLRFELACGDFWIDRLESAKLRARTIADAALGSTERVELIVLTWLDRKEMSTRELEGLATALAQYGLPPATAFETAILPPENDDGDLYAWLGVASIPRTHVDRVIWAAVASDFGFFPRAPGRLFVLNEDHELLLHPYDDRGMDVVSNRRTRLQGLYDEYGHWLLDHDRERMDRAFGD